MFEAFAMNEERVLAVAGLFQATALAQQLANEGRCDEQALEASLKSVFRIDAPSVVGVYGNVSGVRLGLRTLIAQLDENGRDMAVTRMAISFFTSRPTSTTSPMNSWPRMSPFCIAGMKPL